MQSRNVFFFEPIASKFDTGIIERYGILTNDFDDFSSGEDEGPVLFYMPHCDRTLYEQLISMRISKGAGESLFLSNHFSKYCVLHSGWESLAESFVEVPFLLYNKDYVRYEANPKGLISTKSAEKSENVPFHAFNDLAFITVAHSDLSDLVDHFSKVDR
jgi:hypothetical protein